MVDYIKFYKINLEKINRSNEKLFIKNYIVFSILLRSTGLLISKLREKFYLMKNHTSTGINRNIIEL